MKTSDPFKPLESALQDNPNCRLGIMARERMAFAEKGVNSFQQDRELLVLISDTGWWYGYIVRVDPDMLAYRDRGEWVAMLVKSTLCVEGETAQEIFGRISHYWYLFGWYEHYYTPERHPEEGLAQYLSFDDAVQATIRIIERFNYQYRMHSEPGNGLRQDLRSLNFFASVGHSDPEMHVMHNITELPIVEGSRNNPKNPDLSPSNTAYL